MSGKYPLALPEGTILAGQYVIEKALGQGGFGITYRARDHKTGQTVAVKEFFPETLATRTQCTVVPFAGERKENYEYGKSCFLQEAETLAQFIGNENIVKIYSYFEEYGTAYFVMEFIEGINFDEFIKQRGGKVSYEEAENVLIKIIDALSVVHSKGIVHRDVTPDNIYITNDGTVKLLDFGAARYSIGDKSRSLDVVLKHGFAPKEQYTRHGKQGPFTDVYTVGASFYFALTGKRPPDSIDRIETDDLIPPSNLGVVIPRHKEDAILKAMGVQPVDRFQTMAQFKSALCGEGSVVGGTQQMATTGAVNQIMFNQQPMQPVQQPIQPMQPVQPAQPMQSVQPMQMNNGMTTSYNNQMMNEQPGGKKDKTKLYIAIAALVFICIMSAIFAPSLLKNNDDKEKNTTPEKGHTYVEETTTTKKTQATTAKPVTQPTTTKKEETTTKAPSVSYKMGTIDSMTLNNVSNGGYYSKGGDGSVKVIGGQLNKYNPESKSFDIIDEGSGIKSINAYSNTILYVKDGNVKVYRDGKIGELSKSVNNVYSIYAHDNGNGQFIVYKTDEGYKMRHRTDANGMSKYCTKALKSPDLVTFMNEKAYYVVGNTLLSAGLDFFYVEGLKGSTVLDLSGKGKLMNMVSENGYIYILSYVEAESKAIITRYNTANGKNNALTVNLTGKVPIKINVYNNKVYILYEGVDRTVGYVGTYLFDTDEYIMNMYTSKEDKSINFTDICIENGWLRLRGYNSSNKQVTVQVQIEDGKVSGDTYNTAN